MQMFIYSALVGFTIMAAVVEMGFCSTTDQDQAKDESATQTTQTKPVQHFKDESQRVGQQKDAGILKGDRDYGEKSDFVKNRDRVTGAAEKLGESAKDAVNSLLGK